MKATRVPSEMETRAAEALGTLLHSVSSIKTRDIKFQPAHRKTDILADISVLGRSRQLVCSVADGEPDGVRRALDKLQTSADRRKHDATPILITKHMSAQARALCEERRVGFLDLDGNARLIVDEVFIGKRSVRSGSLSNPLAPRLSA
ncbi:MAG TPA: hypothetical protein VGJ21_03450 [Terracidiphilus sp.]|jgi:hypothetical protein